MGTLLATTPWQNTRVTGVTTFTVPLSQPAAAGSKLILVAFGGATVTAKISNTAGAAFAVRTNLASGQGTSIHDFVAVGGETAVFCTLNGAENVAGIIYEVANLGAFIAATNTGGALSVTHAGDDQSKPPVLNVPSGAALLVGGWTGDAALATKPFDSVNQWRQMGPIGKLYANTAMQPGANTQFIYASGLADVSAASRYPANLANAGDYQATSDWISTGTTYAVQAAYADTSGVATVPLPANPIARENSLPGTHQSNWFGGQGASSSTIAGYCDKTSYLPGDTVNFKVDSSGFPFRVEIFRLGYYGWETFGARLMTGNSAGYIVGAVVAQPAPTVDATLGSTSCAWTTNATWAIPATAPPGVYYVQYRRTDALSNVASGLFIVGAVSNAGKAVVCLSDITYQAYNVWGATNNNGTLAAGVWSGRSMYTSGTDASNVFAHRSYAVCFDRPYGTQATQTNTYIFDSDFGMIAFLEAQGYDLSYASNIDLDNNTTLLNTASLIILQGHHEYITKNIYDCLTNAVDAGVNMLVNGSNVALWRGRFAAADVNKRTYICYKESSTADVSPGWTGTGYDPVSYTGTWRDTRTNVGTVNNPDVRRENTLTGQMFRVSAPVNVAATVPFAQRSLPIWRNSAAIQALTVGQVYTTPIGVLGDELEVADGSVGQPANLVMLCPTPTGSLANGANAAGTTYTTPVSLTAGFTLYRRPSGALVFNTGSWRGFLTVSRWRLTTLTGTTDVNWQNALNSIMYDLGMVPVAVREMQPGTDTALTNPAVGAVPGGRNAVAAAYGLQIPASGGFLMFF